MEESGKWICAAACVSWSAVSLLLGLSAFVLIGPPANAQSSPAPSCSLHGYIYIYICRERERDVSVVVIIIVVTTSVIGLIRQRTLDFRPRYE